MMVAGIFFNIYLVKIDVKFIYAKNAKWVHRRKPSEIVLLVVVFVCVCGWCGISGFVVVLLGFFNHILVAVTLELCTAK